MVKKIVNPTDEQALSLEVTALPETEPVTEPVTETVTAPLPVTESAELPVVEVVVEAPSTEGDKDHQDIKILEQKIADLEDKFVKLQTELESLLSKKKKKKYNKEKKVKCKCKDKKVELAQCKCKTKKLAK